MRTQIGTQSWVEYDDVGRGEALVLLHAFPFAREMWRPQLSTLRDVVRVIAPDLRGFGGASGFDGPPSVEQMARDVAALLDALEVTRPAVIGGLSMRGYVALAFARLFPHRLR